MATQYGSWGSINSNKANYRVCISYTITETADSYTVNVTNAYFQAYSSTYNRVNPHIGTVKVYINGVSLYTANNVYSVIQTRGTGTIEQSGNILGNTISKSFSKTHNSQSVTIKLECANTYFHCITPDGSGVDSTTRTPNTTAYTSAGAKTSYTISFNLQGGSGSFGNLTKWYNEPLTIHSGKPTRTNYTFNNWKIRNTSATVPAGGQIAKSYNSAYTLDAQWTIITYPVTFDANGGTGGPANTTKNSGSALTFSSAKPTKKDASSGKAYDFLGWAETSAPDTIVYPVGNTTIAADVNRAVNLIAVWQEHYYPPTITNTKIYRCNENGQASDEGKYAYVSFDWAIDNWKYPTNTASEVKVTVGDITKTIPEAVDRLSGSVAVMLGSPVGKNLLPYPYYKATETVNGITFTDNGDGTITANGTATANAQHWLRSRTLESFVLPSGDYIITDGIGGSSSTTRTAVNATVNGENVALGSSYQNNGTFTVSSDATSLGVYIQIQNGQTVNNLVFKPMIRLASDSDSTYEPYKEQLFDVDTEYPVTISVADKQASTETLYKTTVTGRLNVAEYPLDFGSAVNSIGVFKPASDEAEYEKVIDIGGEVVISGSNGNNDRQFHISVKKNENSGDIGWNWANGDGAGIGLRSADREDAPGEFQIYARNSTEGHHTLIGRTNGWLVWNGNFQTLGFDGNHVSKFGCQNADFCHIYTDATYFAINKTIAMVGQGGIGTPSYPCGSMRIARASAIYLNVGSSRDSTYIEGYDTGGTDNIMLYADGYIAMYCGSTSVAPAAKAYVMQGGITSYVNITAPKFVTSSDERLKENIKDLDIDVDDILLKLNPVEYNWIEDYNESKERHFGFVAQDVQKILEDAGLDVDDLGIITKFDLPEHETLKDKYYALSYEEFVPLLVEGYKKQHDEIEDLKKQVGELKELVAALNARTY